MNLVVGFTADCVNLRTEFLTSSRADALIGASGWEVVAMDTLDREPAANLERLREGARQLCRQKQEDMNRVCAMLRAAAMRCRRDSYHENDETRPQFESMPARMSFPALRTSAIFLPNAHERERTPRFRSIAALPQALRSSSQTASTTLPAALRPGLDNSTKAPSLPAYIRTASGVILS